MAGKPNALSLRISDGLRERLTIVRDSYSRSLGEKLTTKEALSRHLHQIERDGQAARDVFALLACKEQHLRRLRQKLDRDEPFTRAEWSFIAHLAHDAYFYEPPGRSAYASEYVANAVRAFAAVINVRNTIGTEPIRKDRFYMGNLMGPVGFPSGDCAPGLLQEAADYTVGFIEREPVVRCQATSMVSNLLIVLRDERPLPDMELDAALRPFKRSLFISAVRGFFTFQRVNGNTPLTYYRNVGDGSAQQESFETTLLTEHHELALRGDAVHCRGQLTFRHNRIALKLDLTKLEDLAAAMCHGAEAPELRFDTESKRLIDGPMQRRMSTEEAVDLRELCGRYLSDDRIQPQRELGKLAWGAI